MTLSIEPELIAGPLFVISSGTDAGKTVLLMSNNWPFSTPDKDVPSTDERVWCADWVTGWRLEVHASSLDSLPVKDQPSSEERVARIESWARQGQVDAAQWLAWWDGETAFQRSTSCYQAAMSVDQNLVQGEDRS